mmetsp:Transcript_23012/g.43220  ORF Transcript_23012/g.43220 Transcript_23012/m.43220 type:complete len:249 (+) Transcript_23012:590-1336(+)
MIPSPAKTIPLRNCEAATNAAGPRAASLTASTAENFPIKGKHKNWADPRINPASAPQVSMRSATLLPPLLLSSSLAPALPISEGTSIPEVVESASITVAPSCQKITVSWYAAAFTPPGSNAAALFVALSKATFITNALIWTARPPLRRGFRACHFGNRSICFNFTICCLSIRVRNTAAEKNSAATVAAAAPTTPRPNLNIRIGSRAQFMMLLIRETLRGVVVSSFPRNAEKPTVAISAGMTERLRILR